jgi:SAM-dependent methyltransferase
VGEENPAATMLRLVQGAWTVQALHVVAALGIADELKDGPVRSDQLAATTGTHPEALHRLLRFLTSVGVFAGDDDTGGFRLTPVGELLRSDVPGSERERAIAYGTWNYQAWGDLMHTIRTGETAFDHVFGMRPYDYLAQHPELARRFDRQMQRGEAFFAEVPDAYNFTAAKTIVDIAGGNGTLLSKILAATPTARGILFDASHVVEAARDNLRERGVLDRCAVVGGNFFESVPSGGDVYILSRILHNWRDEDCLVLLRNCREAMPPEATLVILEYVIPDEGDPYPALALDVNMMTVIGGRERSWAEFRTLLGKGGFEALHRRPLQSSGVTLLTARPS